MVIKYLRMMKADIDKLPLIMQGERDCLAVRTSVVVNEPTEIEGNIDVFLDSKMMTEIRVNYEKAINQLLVQGTSRQALFAFINDMVDDYGRAGGSLAFNILNDALDNDLSEEVEEVVVDALEALSGQCNRKCWIGSGDYHLEPKAA